MNDVKMTLGSLFDGIAGFPLAAKQNGIETVWASEIEENCIEIAKYHFPDVVQLGDIREIKGEGIQPVDIISFGSPCQNLSIAGDQRGLDGKKSTLFFEAIRIIYEMRGATDGKYPKYIIWENVAGAFSSNKGQDFRRVLEEITKTYIPIPKSGKWATAGMVRGSTGSTAWRQMDAQYWGVPQRRKRIYLVHDFAGDSAGEILFECESVLGYTTQGRTTKQDIARSSERGIGTTNIEHIPYRNCGYGVYAEGIGTLRASRGNNGGGSETLIVRKEMTFAEAYQHHGYRISDVANTQTAGANTSIRGDTSLIIENGIIPFDDFAKNEDGRYWACICEKCVKQNNISENLLDDVGVGICGVAGCENEADYYIDFPEIEEPKGSVWKIPLYLLQGEKEHKKYKVRRFTPTECERLNGFPDGWTEKRSDGKDSSDTARYVSLGNSIAVPCADRVFAGIIAVEKRKQEAVGQ